MRAKLLIFLISHSLVIISQNFNPIIPDNIADPSIYKFGDTYYLYGTTDIDEGLKGMGPPVVWKSKDFVNWSFEGVGYLNNIPDTRNNLALDAKATASSYKEEKTSTEKIETSPNNPEPDEKSVVVASRKFTYEPQNAIDGSNGIR